MGIDFKIEVLYYILRIFLAAACGFVIGYERKTRSKEAGVRTHTIVAMSAALMMIISKYGFADMQAGANFDGSRIAAQIITGIGFLGAGMIFYRRDMLHGLTTAAGVWGTAGIGMALGAGMYVVGVGSTFILIGLQIIMHLPIKWLKGRTYTTLKVMAIIDEPEKIPLLKQIFKVEKFLKYKSSFVNGEMTADIELNTSRVFLADEIYRILIEYPFITCIEKNDEV
ncbi:MAG: MgtC/SapB family protein [Clostridia bacterium]|nr:MgtC/SapB family protein [Clostridia bacterium]